MLRHIKEYDQVCFCWLLKKIKEILELTLETSVFDRFNEKDLYEL